MFLTDLPSLGWEMGHLWELVTKTPGAILIQLLYSFVGHQSLLSHVPFSVLQYLKETWKQKLFILSGWVPIQTKTAGMVFLERCQLRNWPEYFLEGLTCNSTRRSCRSGHFIMSTPPIPLGADNLMTSAFISIFQPFLCFPSHIVTTEQIRP